MSGSFLGIPHELSRALNRRRRHCGFAVGKAGRGCEQPDKALCLVVRTLCQLSQPQSHSGDAAGSKREIIRAESLGKNLTSKWGAFRSPLADLELINSAAHWDY